MKHLQQRWTAVLTELQNYSTLVVLALLLCSPWDHKPTVAVGTNILDDIIIPLQVSLTFPFHLISMEATNAKIHFLYSLLFGMGYAMHRQIFRERNRGSAEEACRIKVFNEQWQLQKRAKQSSRTLKSAACFARVFLFPFHLVLKSEFCWQNNNNVLSIFRFTVHPVTVCTDIMKPNLNHKETNLRADNTGLIR